MSAGSFAELFLQFFAWGMYNTLWDVFVNLGIVYIPFGFYLYEAYTSTREKGSHKMNASRVLAYLEMKLFIGIAVLTLAGVPTINLNLGDMKFNQRTCTPGSSVAAMISKATSGSGTGTTLDDTFTTASMGSLTSKIPVFWAAVFAVGQSITDGVRVKIPCKSSISETSYQLKTNQIQDPAVRQEIGNFYHSCYKKARAKFDANTPVSYTKAQQQAGDAGWLGSNFFMTENGYYNSIQSDYPVKGFAFDESGADKGWWNGSPPKPQWGRPYCKDWYQNSLRSKIINAYDNTWWNNMKLTMQSFKDDVPGFNGTPTEAEDLIIRSLIDVSDVKTITNPQDSVGSSVGTVVGNLWDMINPFGSSSAKVNVMAEGVANAGTGLANLVFYPTIAILKKAMPYVQAFVLAGLVMFLPFLLILSQYGVKEVLTMGALLVSVKFWPVIWDVGDWMDASLQAAILPSTAGFVNGLTLGTAEALSINDDVLDYVIGAWYVMGPVILSTVITMAGYRVGGVIEASGNANHSGKAAAQKGGGTIESVVKTGASKGIK